MDLPNLKFVISPPSKKLKLSTWLQGIVTLLCPLLTSVSVKYFCMTLLIPVPPYSPMIFLSNSFNKLGSQNPPTPLPSLSKEFETKIIGEYGGTRITRVIQKYLTETDVSKGHSRVTIPCSQVESFNFFDGEEMTNLRLGRSITVPLIHTPTENGMSLPLSETSLEFGQWDLHKDKNNLQKVSYQYVLKTNWNTIVQTNDLRKKDHVQIWAFRDVDNKLCMTLVKL